ncbi:MAG: DUF371 domain-containing protein [Methanoregula sp.]|nr:DUF371 domain-containing protein [Methanoregula sp.]
MEAQEIIRCHGHPLVRGTHPTTFEVTCENYLTRKGNCIIGIAADKGCAGLSPVFKSVLAHNDAHLVTTLACHGEKAEIHSHGSSQMLLDHPTDMVWRKSTFVCGRTIGIQSDYVALTLPKAFVQNLIAGKEMELTLVATRPG